MPKNKKKKFPSHIEWTQEILNICSDLIEKRFSYTEVANKLNVLYPEYNFTKDAIRSQKRYGNLSVSPKKSLPTSVGRATEQRRNFVDESNPTLENDNPYFKAGRKKPNLKDDFEPGHDFESLGNYAILDYRGEKNPATLKDLLKACDVDKSIWQVERYVVNKWEVAMKMGETTIVHRPLFQVKAWLVREKPIVVEFPTIQPINPVNIVTPKKKVTSKKEKVALIIPDSQIGFARNFETGVLDPFHDRRALDLCLQMAEKHKPDEIILLGDMLDLPEWSDKFMISPEFYWTTQPAVNELYWWIKELRQHTNKMVYIEGNHELRMAKAVIKNIIAAYNLKPANEPKKSGLTVPSLLALDELDVTYLGPYPDGEYWLNDNLRISHGQIARKGGGKTASAILTDARNSEIVGHIHRHEMAQKTVHPRNGIKTYVAYSPGTVARIDGVVPAYQSRNDWQQGMALVHFEDKNGMFQIVPYNIHDGKTMADGHMMKYRKTTVSKLKKMIK